MKIKHHFGVYGLSSRGVTTSGIGKQEALIKYTALIYRVWSVGLTKPSREEVLEETGYTLSRYQIRGYDVLVQEEGQDFCSTADWAVMGWKVNNSNNKW